MKPDIGYQKRPDIRYNPNNWLVLGGFRGGFMPRGGPPRGGWGGGWGAPAYGGGGYVSTTLREAAKKSFFSGQSTKEI